MFVPKRVDSLYSELQLSDILYFTDRFEVHENSYGDERRTLCNLHLPELRTY